VLDQKSFKFIFRERNNIRGTRKSKIMCCFIIRDTGGKEVVVVKRLLSYLDKVCPQILQSYILVCASSRRSLPSEDV
jgi:hypothetical protein